MWGRSTFGQETFALDLCDAPKLCYDMGMAINVAVNDHIHSSNRVESTASADTARNVLDRLTGISPTVEVTLTVANDAEEQEAAKFLSLVTADARYTTSITGERTHGEADSYTVFVTVTA